ncbi:Cof-like hydrolase [Thermomonospora curvata DSM 43183]|uniref:Cof-like hydrolase n=1 Tax=Thermomonospora curvata (strain ATCC 19995 / DSM 43183 / JCM 3096 / KCTC 9072 / NBRC 15933 / NCIMB 10081 / Henssen B9) TaxID=471852 RepID=D1AEB7_THECD|nr:Cof-like hydrolase [Thermomonospora curvata DSM 43183]PKK16319.1 MAG: Cof-type HAD-IIB family hydrolase [Thermomonospora sp. CIF 1]
MYAGAGEDGLAERKAPPRLVATDLDGTLVRSDGTISARTVQALARVERAGSTLVMVTGRPPRWMRDAAAAVDHRGIAICANGAVLYDLHTETVLRTRLIEAEVVDEVVRRLREAAPEFRFAVEYTDGFVYEASYDLGRWDLEALGGRPVGERELVSRGGIKLLAFHPGADPDRLAEETRKAVGDLVTVTHSSGRGLMEMSAHGVTKASALAELCAERGVAAADVVAFGDMPNDLPMLTWAGTSYGVANGHPDVLSAVTHTIGRNDDDGVAKVLEQLFPATGADVR